MMVDVESAGYEQTEEGITYMAKSQTNLVMSLYRDHLQCMKYDEVLLPKRPLGYRIT